MKQQPVPEWHTIEQQAYHAYREWPIWLALRQKELRRHVKPSNPPEEKKGLSRKVSS